MNRLISQCCLLFPLSLLAACGQAEDSHSGPAAYDASFLDLGADPCSDFYRYACGAWVAQHPPLSGYRDSRFSAGSSRENTFFWRLLRDMQSSDPTLAGPRRYYEACLGTRQGLINSDSTLQTLLDIPNSLQAAQDLPSVLAQLHAEGVTAFFYAGSQIDRTDPSRYGLVLRGYGFSLRQEEYADAARAAAYRAHIDKLSRGTRPSLGNGSAALDSQIVFDIERSVAEASAEDIALGEQYDAYEPVPGTHVNGALTLGENIADWGGMRLAYAAFEALPNRGGSGPYSAEQTFFLAQAQAHCSSYSPELQTRLLQSDPHSPDALRVNGVVRNLPEFAEAFSCSASAQLAPENRCQVW